MPVASMTNKWGGLGFLGAGEGASRVQDEVGGGGFPFAEFLGQGLGAAVVLVAEMGADEGDPRGALGLGWPLHLGNGTGEVGALGEGTVPARNPCELNSIGYIDTRTGLRSTGMNPAEIIPQFDAFLAERGLALEGIAAGGTALALLGVISRETRDCDLIEPELSAGVREAAIALASGLRDQGKILRDDWLNNGPASLAPLLPEGWRQRLQLIHQGKAIRLWALGRPELLLSKLFALCDRGLDLPDCLALQPSATELARAEIWIEAQDLNPEWPAHVRAALQNLGRRLGHGL